MRTKRVLPWLVLALAAVSLAVVAAASGHGQKATAAKKLRIGLVTDIGGLNDRGFNQLAYQGLLRAGKQLGVQTRVLTSTGPNDYIPNFSSLAKQNYDLIVGVGFLQTDALRNIAHQFPKIKFANIDTNVSDLAWKKGGAPPKNAQGILFREQEAGYLVGYLAALDAKRQAKETIGSVGGLKIPPVDRYIAGYQAGAKAADPNIKVLNGYSQSFTDQAACKEIALAQITQGASSVFQVAGGCGLGALDAAKEKGVFGIGVDNDQSFLGPHVMTSAVKKVDVAVFDVIKAVVKRTYRGGTNAIFDLKSGGVGLGKFSPNVPKSETAQVTAIAAKIKSGAITNIPQSVP